jgi:phosphatidylserine/phosphatidylglycerophosphate/cardiolipin synthase-like enzyme
METFIGKGIGKYFEDEIFSAKNELKISTPAIALDFCKKIINMAENGVKIKIITSNTGAADSEPANQLAQSFIKESKKNLDYKIVSMKECALIHAKIFVIDETCAIVGSANFSENSFRNFAEYMLIFREPENIKQINNDFEKLWNSFNYSKIEMPGIKKDIRNKIKSIRRKI